MNIVLLGLMGVGKTTYGKLLATRLGRTFVDTDDLVIQRSGNSIKEIFEKHSEEHFRNIEQKVVEELSQQDNLVIATGGGVIAHEPSVKKLKENGILVGLVMDPNILFERIKHEKDKRPLLTGKSDEEIRALMGERLKHHFHCDFNLELVSEDKEQVVSTLIRVLTQKLEGK